MNLKVLGALFIAIAGASLAACGGGAPSSGATPIPVCPAGANAVPAPPDLLYPMPNATGVPDGNFTLVVGYGPVAPPAPQLVPTGFGGYVAGGSWGAPPSPMPSPAATPRSSSETLYGSAIPALASNTAYTLQVTFGNPPCQTTESAGSFTTR